MRKIILFLLFLTFSFFQLCAQINSQWKMYLAYHDNTFNLSAGKKIYGLFNGNLLSYDTQDRSVRLYSKLDGLHGKNIQFLGYSEAEKTLVLVYKDGNIDLMDSKGMVYNIPQLKKATLPKLKINNLFVKDADALISTNTAIVRLDLKQHLLKGYYDFGENIYAAAIFDGDIFVAKEASIYACNLKKNLSDISLWKRQQYIAARNFATMAGKLYFTVAYFVNPYPAGLYSVSTKKSNGLRDYKKADDQYYTQSSFNKNGAIFWNEKSILIINSEKTQKLIHIANSLHAVSLSMYDNNHFCCSFGNNGLSICALKDGVLKNDVNHIGNYGPQRDLCYYISFVGERMLLAGGRMDLTGLHFPGTLAALEHGKWRFFEEDKSVERPNTIFEDMSCIVQDPKDPNHHFASSIGGGLYEFRNFKLIKQYSDNNSPLRSAIPGNPQFIFLDGLTYDKQNNLWMINNLTDTLFWRLSPSGKWNSLYLENLKKAPTLERTLFDKDGNFWAASRRTVSYHTAGLLGIKFPNGQANTTNFVEKYRSNATNEDGRSVKLNGVYAVMQDRNQSIWIGTGEGLYVIDNPKEWFQNNFQIDQIKVPRNDGTDYADYLLNGVPVSALAADGGNRKWIGTYGNGVYLVAPDGTKILQHFTAQNSPLLSNTIYSIAINPATGEVMLATDVGLCSVQGDAGEPQSSLEKDLIQIYPNPVRPDFHGRLTIQGLSDAAYIKITTINGKAVAGGQALGGTFKWDLKGSDGNRVGSGVYNIIAADKDGKKGVVKKVTII